MVYNQLEVMVVINNKKTHEQCEKSQSGFTIVELVVAIVVLGILTVAVFYAA